MRPHVFTWGRFATAAASCMACSGFNEAPRLHVGKAASSRHQPSRRWARFNEAPRLHVGKAAEPSDGPQGLGASMRPHVFTWGRAPAWRGERARGRASMRPHVFTWGRTDHGAWRGAPARASMRPHVFTWGRPGRRPQGGGSLPGFNEAPRLHVGKVAHLDGGCRGRERASMRPHVFTWGRETDD